MSESTPSRPPLTEADAAAYLSVSPAFLAASRLHPPRTDGPPYVRLGRAVRYLPVDLDAYLAARQVRPTRTENESAQAGCRRAER